MRAQLSAHMAEAMRLPILSPLNTDRPIPPVALDRATCVVGRAGVHLPLPSKQVSRAHALIVNDQDCVYIRDLASRNHTFVNDQPVRETLLDESDVIQIGGFSFKCESGFRKSPAPVVYQADRGVLQVDGSEDFTISQRTTVIGSREDCDLQLTGKDVSPVHAVIFERNARRYVRDLHSEEGTFVNGVKVREEQIKPGDEIAIGAIKMRYFVGEKGTEPSSDTISEGAAISGEPAGLIDEDAALPLMELEEPEPQAAAPAEAASPPAPVATASSEEPIPLAGEEPERPESPTPTAPAPDAIKIDDEEEPELLEDSLIPLSAESLQAPVAPEPPRAEASDSAPHSSQVPQPTVPVEGAPAEKPIPAVAEQKEPQGKEAAPPSATPPVEASAVSPEATKVEEKIDVAAGNVAPSPAKNVPSEPEEAALAPEQPAPPAERITGLVGDIAEKAQELESAWRDFQESSSPLSEHPGAEDAGSKEWISNDSDAAAPDRKVTRDQ